MSATCVLANSTIKLTLQTHHIRQTNITEVFNKKSSSSISCINYDISELTLTHRATIVVASIAPVG